MIPDLESERCVSDFDSVTASDTIVSVDTAEDMFEELVDSEHR